MRGKVRCRCRVLGGRLGGWVALHFTRRFSRRGCDAISRETERRHQALLGADVRAGPLDRYRQKEYLDSEWNEVAVFFLL